jgi:hypothetical protein
MITVAVLLGLAVVSVHVRQFVNRAALFVLDAVGLGCVFVSAALEAETRRRRLFGLVLFALFFVGLWGGTTLIMRLVLWLP